MVDVKSKRCQRITEINGVNVKCDSISPIFNNPGEPVGIYCGDHKDPDMVDVRNKRCQRITEIDGVNVKCSSLQPSFNKPGKPVGIYCGDHKDPDMVDVVHRKCQKEGCVTRCQYGFSGQSPIVCGNDAHRSEGMICQPTKRCKTPKCKDIALYGYRIGFQVACELHMEENMLCLVSQRCSGITKDGLPCNVLETLKNGLCWVCGGWSINKVREAEVKYFLSQNGYEDRFVYNSRIESTSLRERPDFLFRGRHHDVILEVDETQHKKGEYTKRSKSDPNLTNDEMRMRIIVNETKRPTIFIRYNPDEYTIQGKSKNPGTVARQKELKKWLDDTL
jgi:hypothetical protein